MERLIKGKRAEDAACEYLLNLGLRILERNYRVPLGEIDIIAKDNKTIVFVEVRSRQEASCGLPQETVNIIKQRKIRKVAACFLKSKGNWEANCRFDVIAVLHGNDNEIKTLEHISDAF